MTDDSRTVSYTSAGNIVGVLVVIRVIRFSLFPGTAFSFNIMDAGVVFCAVFVA